MKTTTRSVPRTDPCGTTDNSSYDVEMPHDSEHRLICWSGNYRTKQGTQETVRNHQVYEEAVQAKLYRQGC